LDIIISWKNKSYIVIFTYSKLKIKIKIEIQLFGDRINIASDSIDLNENYLKELLISNSIYITGIRKISPSLENAYIHLIKENY